MNDRPHILTPKMLPALARGLGRMDEVKAWALITEAEQLHIIPAIGTELFLAAATDDGTSEALATLLDGGTYDDDGGKAVFAGLRQAAGYFIFARSVMDGDYISTRYGTVIKTDDYSSRPSAKERADCYSSALEVAQSYLGDCLRYARTVGLLAAEGCGRGKMRSRSAGGLRIRRIGD